MSLLCRIALLGDRPFVHELLLPAQAAAPKRRYTFLIIHAIAQCPFQHVCLGLHASNSPTLVLHAREDTLAKAVATH